MILCDDSRQPTSLENEQGIKSCHTNWPPGHPVRSKIR